MATVAPLRTINSQNRELQLIQGAVSDWVSQVEHTLSDPILDGNIVDKVLFTNANQDMTVNHGLGKSITGYEVIRKDKAVDIYDSPNASPNPNLTAILRSSVAQATVTLRFF